MNRVFEVGYLTDDPKISYYTHNGEALQVAKFTIGVNRNSGVGEEKKSDFIRCVAFGSQAKYAEKALHKGDKYLIEGRLQQNNYTNRDGVKMYSYQVVVDRYESMSVKKRQNDGRVTEKEMQEMDAFMDSVDSSDLPFV